MKFAKAILLLAQVNINIYGFLWEWILYGVSYGAQYGQKFPSREIDWDLDVSFEVKSRSKINKCYFVFNDNERPEFKLNQKVRILRTGSYGRAGIFVL